MSNFMVRQFYQQRREFEQTYCERNACLPPEGIRLSADIPYLPDGLAAHRLDVLAPAQLDAPAPIVVNVHGGGLIMGSKEFNRPFCAGLAAEGFVVFDVEYRLLPDVNSFDQFQDVLDALHFICAHGGEYGGDTRRLFLCGDSAGAFLLTYVTAMQSSPEMAKAAHVRMGDALPICGLGLVSGMFYSRKLDKIGLFMPKYIYSTLPEYKGFRPYSNPEHPAVCAALPPCYLVTSQEDFLKGYTLGFAAALKRRNRPYQLTCFPKGGGLTHAFSAFEPERPESRQVIREMAAFFKSL